MIDQKGGSPRKCNDLTIYSGGVFAVIEKSLEIEGNYTNNGIHAVVESISFSGAGSTIDGNGSFLALSSKKKVTFDENSTFSRNIFRTFP